MLVHALWPDAVQPLQLWRATYDSCWQAFIAGSRAAYGIQIPEFPSVPEPDMGIQTYLLGFDVMEFFREISTIVPLNSLRYGLNVILEESFEDEILNYWRKNDEYRIHLFSDLGEEVTSLCLSKSKSGGKGEYIATTTGAANDAREVYRSTSFRYCMNLELLAFKC